MPSLQSAWFRPASLSLCHTPHLAARFSIKRWKAWFLGTLLLFHLSLGVVIGQVTQITPWRELPLGGGGFFTGIHFHPTQAGLAYLRSDVAGPWKRSVSTEAWTNLAYSNYSPSLIRNGHTASGTGAVVFDPRSTQIIYAEFIGRDTGTPVGGLYKSIDGGANWAVTRPVWADPGYGEGTRSKEWGPALAIDPNNADVVYFGSMKAGVHRTLDAGASWIIVRAYDGDGVNAKLRLIRQVAVDGASPVVNGRSSVVYAGVYDLGITRSVDGGQTWSPMSDAFNQGLLALRPSTASGTTFYITCIAVGPDRSLYVGHVNGLARFNPLSETWSTISIPGTATDSSADFVAVTSGVGGTTRLAVAGLRSLSGGNRWAVYRSLDGGASWLPALYPGTGGNTSVTKDPVQQGLFQDISQIVFNPHVEGEVYVTDAFSLYKSTNFWSSGTVAWVNDTKGAENVVAITLHSSPSSSSGNAAPIYTGCSDVMGFRYPNLVTTPTTGIRATGDFTEYVTSLASLETNADTIWAAKTRNWRNISSSTTADGALLKSSNGGVTWSLTQTNPLASGLSHAGAKIAVSAGDGNNVVFMPGDYRGVASNAGENVSGAERNNLPNRYTTDGGQTWNTCLISGTSNPLPNFVTDSALRNTAYIATRFLVADKVNSGWFYAMAGGQSGSAGRVWRSFDGGATWALGSGVLTTWGLFDSISPPHLAAAPGRAGEVWAGAAGNGVFRSTDAGNTWSRITFFNAPSGSNRASFVSFGKEFPGTGSDNPTVYVFTFPAGGSRPALYRCTNLKAAGTNNAALVWNLVEDWDHGWQPWLIEGDRQVYGRVHVAGAYFAYAQTDGLTGWWRFQETSGSVASDSLGSGLTASFTTAPTWTVAPPSPVVGLTGANAARITDSPLLDGTDRLSLAFWVYPTNLDGTTPRFILGKRTSAAANDAAYTAFIHTGNRLFIDLASDNDRFSTNTTFLNNQWYHVAIVYDGTKPAAERAKVYINGILDKTATETSASLPDSTQDLWIGRGDANSTDYLNARLGDLRLYRSALSDADVSGIVSLGGYININSPTWNAAAGGGWNTGANWVGGNVPANNENLIFDGPTWTSGTITNTFEAGTFTAGDLTINNVDRAWTFGSGPSFNLGGRFLVTNQEGTWTNTFNSSFSLNAGTHEFQINQSGGTNRVNFEGGSVISGAGGIEKTGGGTMAFGGANANTYTGLTTVTNGTLILNKTAGVNAIAGDILLTGTGTLTWNVANQIADSSTLSISGAQLIALSGAISETVGRIYLNGSFGASTGLTISSGGTGLSATTFDTTGYSGTNPALVLGGSSASVVTTFTVGSGGIIMSGQRIQLNGSSTAGRLGNRLVLGGDFTGNGTNTITRDSVAQASGGVNQLDLGSAVRTFNITSGTTTISNASFSSTLSITGVGGGINKTGNGTLNLAAPAIYTGPTTVTSGGITLLSGSSISASSVITVSGGATLSNNSGSAISRPLTLVEGAILSGISAFTPPGLTLSADLTGGSFTSITAGASNLTKSGNVTFNLTNVTAGTYTIFSGTPAGSFSGVSIEATALPTTNSGQTFSGIVGSYKYTFTNSTNTLVVVLVIPDSPVLTIGSSTTGVALVWTDPDSLQATFTLERESAGSWALLATLSSNIVSYLDTGITTAGLHRYRVRGNNTNGSGAWSNIVESNWTDLELWRVSKGLARDGSGSAANTGDPDGDGVNNLLEYALGREPQAFDSSAPVYAGLDGAGRLTLTFFRAKSPAILTYTVQASDDLATWTDLTVNPGSVGQNVVVTDTPPTGYSKRFLRLKVSTP
jgi:autotransporter-associated beta strand protein